MSYGDDSRSAGSDVLFNLFCSKCYTPKWYSVTFVWDTFWGIRYHHDPLLML